MIVTGTRERVEYAVPVPLRCQTESPARMNSDYFRSRAGEVRQLAARATDPNIRSQFLELASQYDQLADEAERLAKQRGNESLGS